VSRFVGTLAEWRAAGCPKPFEIGEAHRADLEAPARAKFAAQQQRKGDWMQTGHGRMFWPMDPRADEVFIEDIAYGLSLQCRYGGHCAYHYSVAQHSVYVSYQVPREHALTALLHDGTEAYCVDVPRPIKRFLAGYADIEARIWRAIAERFALPMELPECVKTADNAVLLAEKAQIMLPSPAPWDVPGTPADIHINEWSPWQARDAFMARFAELIGNGGEAA
jgi:uncharacterized protein